MGNPRRDFFEYSALIILSGSTAAAFGFLLAYASQRNPDGTRRKLPKVNLTDEVDLRVAWDELKKGISEMSWENSTLSRFAKPSGDGPPSGVSAGSTDSQRSGRGSK
jgi:hypothetical protein